MFSSSPTAHEIYRSRLFEEPLVPIGPDPEPKGNAALARVLTAYSQRENPEDFSHLTSFLDAHPNSSWKPSLLLNLGLEYYRTGRYSKALEVWREAWERGKSAPDRKGKALADRAFGELVYMEARLGHMAELDETLRSVGDRVFVGSATERVTGAREGLANMRNHPETSFRCGPHAVHRIMSTLKPGSVGHESVYESVSTKEGCSLEHIAQLSGRLGLNFQMAFREKHAALVIPSVVHFKLDHFAAVVEHRSDRYLLQDPTFGNDVWLSKETLESESSGYFLIPQAELKPGWRAVQAQEGKAVWGKGLTGNNDPGPHGPCDPASPGGGSCPKDGGDCKGLAVSRVHLMLVSLNINDEPIGYTPPVGPSVRFTIRYNQRDATQPANFLYSHFSLKWTFDWLSYITDDPTNPFIDLAYYIMGGGTRTFTGFANTGTINSGTSAFQQLDQTQLNRTSSSSYEILGRDGSRKVFSQPDGSVGSHSRKIFLTQLIDPQGNAVSLGYDASIRIATITDTIGQVTKLSYDHPDDEFKITKVTDPFGRFATFDYDDSGRLTKITDVIGLTSEFTYDGGDFITALTTPYGVTSFVKAESEDPLITTRSLETTYPDGDRDRVEYNQTIGIANHESPRSVPAGMATQNDFLQFRNTYYWSKIAYAAAYPDYTKAKIYHWLHGRAHVPQSDTTAGILESIKEPLEGRVWFDYAGQDGSPNGSISVGTTNKPAHVGRVLDDGSTQLHSYLYNDFGHVIKEVDPVGRTHSYIYAANGIDLLEVQQTRAGQKQLLSKRSYDLQHRLLTSRDAAGQTTTFTYNARGQILTETNAKGETTKYRYDPNGYFLSIDGALPGSSSTFTYDSHGLLHSITDRGGYTLTFAYDALDRLTNVSYPDTTFDELSYTLLNLTTFRDRASRRTLYGYNSIRQKVLQSDPLNRTILLRWCKCGALKTLTDPMGRTTSWRHDIQGRVKSKTYADGSSIAYRYEDTTSRLRERLDERSQVKLYNYNRDDSLHQISYSNSVIATASVSFTYDTDYMRLTSMLDATGMTSYSYFPITPVPALGAGRLCTVAGPLPSVRNTFSYDEVGRVISRGINGALSTSLFDGYGRVTSIENALGSFNYEYDGGSRRLLSVICNKGAQARYAYHDNVGDGSLLRITNKTGALVISEFTYEYTEATGQISSWLQQSGAETPFRYDFTYDAANQIQEANLSKGATPEDRFAYSYDLAGNRLTEEIGIRINEFSYNALNQLTTRTDASAADIIYEWDAENRLTAFIKGPLRVQCSYDGLGRLSRLVHIENGAQVVDRRFVWSGHELCEERTPSGSLLKRFYNQGISVESGPVPESFFYTRDHLNSVREVTDSTGSVVATFSYDPYGRRVQLFGTTGFDFGFSGLFWIDSVEHYVTRFRVYDPTVGRWITRDPLAGAEPTQGPNLYSYVSNDPINRMDPLGLQNVQPKAPSPPPGTPPPDSCTDLLETALDLLACIGCLAEFGAAVKKGPQGMFDFYAGSPGGPGGGGRFCQSCLSHGPHEVPCPPPDPPQEPPPSNCDTDWWAPCGAPICDPGDPFSP
jgi:RHS repeat-associated protein